QTTGNGDVRQVLASIYGMAIAKQLVPITGQSLDYKISGYASMPEITRASRNYISTMINGRFIKNYPLAKAIQEGYHTLLPIGRFPIVLLNIEMDPLLVDVNVHPSKMEVRISKEAELNELVTSIIKEEFKSKILIPTAYTAVKRDVPKDEQTTLVLDEGTPLLPVRKEFEWKQPAATGIVQESRPWLEVPVEKPFAKLPTHQEIEEVREPNNWQSINPFSESHNESDEGGQIVETQPDPIETRDVSPESRIPRLYPIGQMHGTYIFAQNENGLYIIDQHAAQERLKYEYFREKVGQVQSELQEMLVPLTFEYSTDEFVKINEYQNELEKVGVFLEEFGLNSFIVRSHPQWLPKGEEKQIIEDMIEQLLAMKKVDIKKLREEAAIMMSCKASIKANRHLRNDEIQALLDDLRKASDPFTCPHGRPIIVHYSIYEMEKMFKRVM
ncbi:MAG: DNA mismatch repair endonuclease MutL, partial [Bacillus sp. (in: firmicutes)]